MKKFLTISILICIVCCATGCKSFVFKLLGLKAAKEIASEVKNSIPQSETIGVEDGNDVNLIDSIKISNLIDSSKIRSNPFKLSPQLEEKLEKIMQSPFMSGPCSVCGGTGLFYSNTFNKYSTCSSCNGDGVVGN
jgi:DnaJ-class molecular chaperone